MIKEIRIGFDVILRLSTIINPTINDYIKLAVYGKMAGGWVGGGQMITETVLIS